MAAQAVAPASSAKCPVQLKASESDPARGGRLVDQVAAVDEAPCFVRCAPARSCNSVPLGIFHASVIAGLSGSSPPRSSAVVTSVMCIYKHIFQVQNIK